MSRAGCSSHTVCMCFDRHACLIDRALCFRGSGCPVPPFTCIAFGQGACAVSTDMLTLNFPYVPMGSKGAFCIMLLTGESPQSHRPLLFWGSVPGSSASSGLSRERSRTWLGARLQSYLKAGTGDLCCLSVQFWYLPTLGNVPGNFAGNVFFLM